MLSPAKSEYMKVFLPASSRVPFPLHQSHRLRIVDKPLTIASSVLVAFVGRKRTHTTVQKQ